VLRGHRLTVFSYSPRPADATYDHVRLKPESFAYGKLARLIAVPLRLNALPTDDFDVLHVHGDDWFFVRRRLPTVRTFYGSALQEAKQATRARRRVGQTFTFGCEVLASRLATATYGLIPGDGTAYGARGFLPCGVDVPPHSARPDEKAGRPRLLFVGTWNGRKRGAMLHSLFRRHVLPAVPDAELHMVSDHCEPADGVVWWERPTDDELTQLYRTAWAFCLPSTYEGFGIPYVEAMAQGTPVVASPNPGANFILRDGLDGVVAQDGELATHLVRLLTDQSARSQLEAAGRQRSLDFDWSAVIGRYEHAYADAIQSWERDG
jgi:phosphatidylinositol alpha-mannosyltransferase